MQNLLRASSFIQRLCTMDARVEQFLQDAQRLHAAQDIVKAAKEMGRLRTFLFKNQVGSRVGHHAVRTGGLGWTGLGSFAQLKQPPQGDRHQACSGSAVVQSSMNCS